MNGLIGKKIGMTSIFDEKGNAIAVTVIECGPCVVTQVKTEDTDGYSALQLAYGVAKEKNTSKALMGHFAKAGAGALKEVVVVRSFSEDFDKELTGLIAENQDQNIQQESPDWL